LTSNGTTSTPFPSPGSESLCSDRCDAGGACRVPGHATRVNARRSAPSVFGCPKCTRVDHGVTYFAVRVADEHDVLLRMTVASAASSFLRATPRRVVARFASRGGSASTFTAAPRPPDARAPPFCGAGDTSQRTFAAASCAHPTSSCPAFEIPECRPLTAPAGQDHRLEQRRAGRFFRRRRDVAIGGPGRPAQEVDRRHRVVVAGCATSYWRVFIRVDDRLRLPFCRRGRERPSNGLPCSRSPASTTRAGRDSGCACLERGGGGPRGPPEAAASTGGGVANVVPSNTRRARRLATMTCGGIGGRDA